MNIMFQLNKLLEKYPAFIGLIIVFLFSFNTFQSWQMKEVQNEIKNEQSAILKAVDYQTYDFAFRLIERGFAGASTSEDVLNIVQKWKDQSWGAQLVSLDILCYQPKRLRLLELTDRSISTDICRIRG